jgi:hypothetical protein
MVGAVLLAGLVGLGAAPAHAMQDRTAVSDTAGLRSEIARLRSALDRANADVAALKKAAGVRNDYRLRQRMADAEALARQLTRAEAQLRARTGQPTGPAAAPVAAPAAAPGDGPVELEAKADLLVDEARKLQSHADALMRSAGQLRDRQALRRRAAQFERDPFASLDAPKRAMIFGGTRATSNDTRTGTEGTKGTDTSPTVTPPPSTTPTSAPASGAGPGAGGGTPSPPAGSSPPPSAPTSPTSPPTTTIAPGPSVSSSGASAVSATGGVRSVTPTATATTPPTSPGAADVSVQVRTLLDPATLTEIQRLERSGQIASDPLALEKVAAALRLRAQALEQQARAIRPGH